MNVLTNYLNFILRSLPEHESATGMDVSDHFYHRLVFWTAFFTVLFFVFKNGGKKFFPTWFQQLTDRKRKEYPAYATCLVHHLAMVPRAWIHIVRDFTRTSVELSIISYPTVEATIAPFCLGYLLGDTICYALPELIFSGGMEYMIHHVLTAWLVFASMFVNGHLLRFIPHLLICDTTNIFFNIAWLLRTSDAWRGSSIVIVLELAFAFFFLITRVINMPLAFYAIYRSKYSEELGWARITFIPIALLQWYWFSKIVAGISSRFGGGKKSKDKVKSKEHQKVSKDADKSSEKKHA